MTLSPFAQQIFLACFGMSFTVATIIFLNGRYRGKADSLSEQGTQRHKEILDRLDRVDDRLHDIDDRATTAAVLSAELRTTLLGQTGTNGLNGMVKNLDARLRDIENR